MLAADLELGVAAPSTTAAPVTGLDPPAALESVESQAGAADQSAPAPHDNENAFESSEGSADISLSEDDSAFSDDGYESDRHLIEHEDAVDAPQVHAPDVALLDAPMYYSSSTATEYSDIEVAEPVVVELPAFAPHASFELPSLPVVEEVPPVVEEVPPVERADEGTSLFVPYSGVDHTGARIPGTLSPSSSEEDDDDEEDEEDYDFGGGLSGDDAPNGADQAPNVGVEQVAVGSMVPTDTAAVAVASDPPPRSLDVAEATTATPSTQVPETSPLPDLEFVIQVPALPRLSHLASPVIGYGDASGQPRDGSASNTAASSAVNLDANLSLSDDSDDDFAAELERETLPVASSERQQGVAGKRSRAVDEASSCAPAPSSKHGKAAASTLSLNVDANLSLSDDSDADFAAELEAETAATSLAKPTQRVPAATSSTFNLDAELSLSDDSDFVASLERGNVKKTPAPLTEAPSGLNLEANLSLSDDSGDAKAPPAAGNVASVVESSDSDASFLAELHRDSPPPPPTKRGRGRPRKQPVAAMGAPGCKRSLAATSPSTEKPKRGRKPGKAKAPPRPAPGDAALNEELNRELVATAPRILSAGLSDTLSELEKELERELMSLPSPLVAPPKERPPVICTRENNAMEGLRRGPAAATRYGGTSAVDDAVDVDRDCAIRCRVDANVADADRASSTACRADVNTASPICNADGVDPESSCAASSIGCHGAASCAANDNCRPCLYLPHLYLDSDPRNHCQAHLD
ncbi:hypothetical protein SPRG_08324 [Saprolegnia parasitica CBS 223.65]|uniref:Uncharacterized protein n=1 Tax=Saprolegnia parasitica (strain CBS 223.65) TaxID=695850 RepID=A0A067C673_SAPPC|nr:hypothetical protein SPRG_08324 [Saprolegnia parasitica CBS 223.65]KDO26249.1 hypothetical protein SPRG_08324 [Saprolegnia parasitica CBS 223.65]|eukprot:XP_012202958.1 hypothetical protein SPRG_08324 [Saprolegnia parasitica CBS 223.65]